MERTAVGSSARQQRRPGEVRSKGHSEPKKGGRKEEGEKNGSHRRRELRKKYRKGGSGREKQTDRQTYIKK